MDTDLIYGIDDRPPLKETLFAAIQHLLAIFVAIITPPLIIAGGAETGSGDDRFLGFHGPIRLRGIHIRSMS